MAYRVRFTFTRLHEFTSNGNLFTINRLVNKVELIERFGLYACVDLCSGDNRPLDGDTVDHRKPAFGSPA